MNWLNVRLPSLRLPEYVGSEPVARATWWNVLAYCCEQENGGRIVGAKAWKCRQWQQTCGVMASEVDSAPLMLKWDGDDLVVWNYPADKEAEIRVKREAGKVGGERSGEARTKQTFADNRSSPSTNGSSSPPSSASTEGERKENRNKKEKKNGVTADSFSFLPVQLDTPEFRSKWIEYLRFRKASKFKPLQQMSVVSKFEQFTEWGVDAAIAQIDESIRNGWQGIFVPKAGAKIVKIVPQPELQVLPAEVFKTPRQILEERKAREAAEESQLP